MGSSALDRENALPRSPVAQTFSPFLAVMRTFAAAVALASPLSTIGSAITACFRERPLGILTTLVEGIKHYSANPPLIVIPGSR